LYFNCKVEASTSVVTFYITAALPDRDRIYRPKRVVNVKNK